MRALVAVALLVLVLPFEPMAPWTTVAGMKMSHLEIAAFMLLVVAASGLTFKRTSLPLAMLAVLFALAVFLSAAFAEGALLPPLKFSLRMTAGVVAFAITSLALSAFPRLELLRFAFAAAGTATAAIAIAEAAAPPTMENLLAPFREHAFEVGGQHRVAATFSYPNTAGGFLALTLPFAMSFIVSDNVGTRVRSAAFVATLAIFSAIMLTYSRGALLAAVAAATVLTFLIRRPGLFRVNASCVLVAAALFWVDPSFRWRASSENDRTWYRAEIQPESNALELRSGELADTRVRVKNVGNLTWSSTGEKRFHLSHRWFRFTKDGRLAPLALEGERTRLFSPLRPGRAVELTATVRAPQTPGVYLLIWDMVHEHTTWFSDKVGLGTPVHVAVDDTLPTDAVRPEQIEKMTAARAWRPGRRELWTIALGLFLERPILGIGPDNFRWRYGAFAGKDVWDTRVFSNSLYLELLSTTGIVGFAVFLGLMARALVGLARKVRVSATSLEAATVAAALVGFLVHGLFDYLLAFTPIYLALFILLGSASALSRV